MSSYITYRVQTNIDKLDSKTIHGSFGHMVKDVTETGSDFLKIIVPRGETQALAMHAGHKGPVDDGINILSEIGVPMIFDNSLDKSFDPNSMIYPIFVDQGTGIYGFFETPIFAKRAKNMMLPPKGDLPIFYHMVKGQRPRHFMAATYTFIHSIMNLKISRMRDELKIRLKADKLT